MGRRERIGLPLLRDASAWCKQTLGREHPDTLAALVFLAQGLAVTGTTQPLPPRLDESFTRFGPTNQPVWTI